MIIQKFLYALWLVTSIPLVIVIVIAFVPVFFIYCLVEEPIKETYRVICFVFNYSISVINEEWNKLSKEQNDDR